MERLVVRDIFKRWIAVRAGAVVKKQPQIKFGGKCNYADVEADEVTLAKHVDPNDANKVVWDGFLGPMERDNPKSLVIQTLEERSTTKRAPGPGTLRLKEWKVLGQKWLNGRRVILHTDGARAYRLKIKDVQHTAVTHQKKKINNKRVKPKFVKETLVDCDGAQVRVKAGTQFIDGWWRILKKECRYLKASRAHNVDLVRAAQRNHWHQGEDKVVAATSALACVFRV
jgi:hypothetical protein